MSTEIESILKEIPTLKAPGVSGSRIKRTTQLALENVHDESAIVSALYLQCKTAPATHKLGVLYVIDSIMRLYAEDAKKHDLPVDDSAPDGTTASGAYKISTYIESLIDDSMNGGIDDKQREKIAKLVDIWERCQTFNGSTISSIRDKYFKSSTPPGSPPPSLKDGSKPLSQPLNVPDQSDPMALLQTLLSLNKQQNPGNPANVGAPQQDQPASGRPNLNDPNAIFNMLKQMGQTETLEPSFASRSSEYGSSGPPPHRRDRDRSPGRYGRPNYRDRERSTPDQYQDRYSNSNHSRSPPLGHLQFQDRERNVPGTPHFREKHVSYDNNLPSETIKVFSRTLFIGGVPPYMDEQELAAVLRPYAEVQSVILNSERKHAFVKVYSRPELEQVISNFSQSGNTQLRTRWGVGFGPRDCCDYQHGVSMIPISRLTELDKRWIVAAEWGGTGGSPLVPGLVIDEPDIEIGSGVSSKAISRKMPTNSARNGPRSNRPGEPIDRVVRAQAKYDSNGYQGNNNVNNPLQNLFGNKGSGNYQGSGGAGRDNGGGYSSPGQPLQQQPANGNVNSIMQSLTLMMNQPSGGSGAPPAAGNGQLGLTPELQLLLSKMNQQK